MDQIIHPIAVVSSVLFSLIGILILVVSFYIIEKITPENLYREVIDKQNTAVSLVVGAFIIAVSIR
ncbi:MAG TPA: DUF350 domain-containing protein, partial [Chitinophagales bacterium]|nr:DUF350 domain-containing protein [Chitinophagales bacterium]